MHHWNAVLGAWGPLWRASAVQDVKLKALPLPLAKMKSIGVAPWIGVNTFN